MSDCLVPDWPAPKGVRALVTTRAGGVSQGAYASLNVGAHVGDEPHAVAENRRRLAALLPQEPIWLQQVHGTQVVDAGNAQCLMADAIFTRQRRMPCAVMVADCLPVLLCDEAGTVVAAAHAGWRGLCDGVIERTVAAMDCPPHRLLAWLGPAIGPTAFELGGEVRDAFISHHAADASEFSPRGPEYPDKFLADIYGLAKRRLVRAGVVNIFGGGFCTVTDPTRFFSYRRNGKTGRMAAVVWVG